MEGGGYRWRPRDRVTRSPEGEDLGYKKAERAPMESVGHFLSSTLPLQSNKASSTKASTTFTMGEKDSKADSRTENVEYSEVSARLL